MGIGKDEGEDVEMGCEERRRRVFIYIEGRIQFQSMVEFDRVGFFGGIEMDGR